MHTTANQKLDGGRPGNEVRILHPALVMATRTARRITCCDWALKVARFSHGSGLVQL